MKILSLTSIAFNNHEDYVIPSYHVLKMFAENRGDYVCVHTVTTESDRRIESGYFTDESGNITEGNRFSIVYKNTDKIHIRFWDRGTVGEDQNHYDWVAENGTSKVVHYNGWSAEVICKEIPYVIPGGNVKADITAEDDSFCIVMNGKAIHKHTLDAVPHISAVCTIDSRKNEVIIKIVNFSEKEIPVKLSADTMLSPEAVITTLTADSYSAGNSFEAPDAVSPFTEKIMLNDDNTVSVKPRSVNVLRQKIAR